MTSPKGDGVSNWKSGGLGVAVGEVGQDAVTSLMNASGTREAPPPFGAIIDSSSVR